MSVQPGQLTFQEVVDKIIEDQQRKEEEVDYEIRNEGFYVQWSIKTARPWMPWLAVNGITANHLSILSILVRLLSLVVLYYTNSKVLTPLFFGLLWLFGMYLDNIDGYFARHYGEPTVLGAYLDHGGDMFTGALLALVLYKKFVSKMSSLMKWLLILVVLVLITRVGCKYSSYSENDPLSFLYMFNNEYTCDSTWDFLDIDTLTTVAIMLLTGVLVLSGLK